MYFTQTFNSTLNENHSTLNLSFWQLWVSHWHSLKQNCYWFIMFLFSALILQQFRRFQSVSRMCLNVGSSKAVSSLMFDLVLVFGILLWPIIWHTPHLYFIRYMCLQMEDQEMDGFLLQCHFRLSVLQRLKVLPQLFTLSVIFTLAFSFQQHNLS